MSRALRGKEIGVLALHQQHGQMGPPVWRETVYTTQDCHNHFEEKFCGTQEPIYIVVVVKICEGEQRFEEFWH